MSRATRPRVRAVFRIGPAAPGVLLPIAVGVVGACAALLVLTDLVLVIGLVLVLVSALRVRSAAPWLLVALLAGGQLLRPADGYDAELSALVLAVHALVVLTLLARVVPVRSRVQLAALGRPALTLALVQLPAQAIAAALIASAGNLQVLPVASTVGGVLLVLVAGLLTLSRRADDET
jgi:hypothetical protein